VDHRKLERHPFLYCGNKPLRGPGQSLSQERISKLESGAAGRSHQKSKRPLRHCKTRPSAQHCEPEELANNLFLLEGPAIPSPNSPEKKFILLCKSLIMI